MEGYERDSIEHEKIDLLRSIDKKLDGLLHVGDALLDKLDEVLAARATGSTTITRPITPAASEAAGSPPTPTTPAIRGYRTYGPDKAIFNVVLVDAGNTPQRASDVIVELANLDVDTAAQLIESAPNVVQEDVPKPQAEFLEAKLIEAGATVELIPCDQ